MQLFNEKERLAINFKVDMENANLAFKKSLETQSKFSETQILDLKKQLEQQIELNKIVTKVDHSTKNIEELVTKYANEKYKTIGIDQDIFDNKQRTLKEFEDRLNAKEKLLNQDLSDFEKRKQEFGQRDKQNTSYMSEEKERIDKELKRLQELQNSMRSLEMNIKEKTEKDKLEMIHRENEKNLEVDLLRSTYNEKMNELEYKQKVLEDDKNYFKLYKEELLKNIKMKETPIILFSSS